MVEDRDVVGDVITRGVDNGEVEGNPNSVECQPSETLLPVTQYAWRVILGSCWLCLVQVVDGSSFCIRS